MLRRVLLAAALIAGTAVSGWAAENASFILTNGQRQSGSLIYGRGDNNIVDLQFHVSVSGSDVAIPINQVAAIDFAGGTPSRAELDALPADSNAGVMVMRDGSKMNGHLHNIIAGDMVQWVNEGGQRNNYPISSVARLYLNPPAAKSAFLSGAAGTSGTAGQTATGAGTTVHVAANRAWTPTGITVQKGQTITFASSGQVQLSTNGGDVAGVTGASGHQVSARGSLPGVPGGALIGRIGNGRPFGIGDQASIVAPATGPLYLGVNDDLFTDNTGEFVVSVSGGTAGAVGAIRRR